MQKMALHALHRIYQIIKIEYATENGNNNIECMTREVAIHKVRTLKSAKYLSPSSLVRIFKTIDVRFWSDAPPPLTAYALYGCPLN